MRKSNLAMAMFWSNLESADLEPFAQYYIAKHQAGLKELEESIRGKHVGGKYDDRDLSRRSCRHSIDPDKGAEQRHLDQPKGMSLGVQALCTGESLISACIHRSGESGTQGGTGPTHPQSVGNGGWNRWCLCCYSEAGTIRNTQRRLCACCTEGHYQRALHGSFHTTMPPYATITTSPAAGASYSRSHLGFAQHHQDHH